MPLPISFNLTHKLFLSLKQRRNSVTFIMICISVCSRSADTNYIMTLTLEHPYDDRNLVTARISELNIYVRRLLLSLLGNFQNPLCCPSKDTHLGENKREKRIASPPICSCLAWTSTSCNTNLMS